MPFEAFQDVCLDLTEVVGRTGVVGSVWVIPGYVRDASASAVMEMSSGQQNWRRVLVVCRHLAYVMLARARAEGDIVRTPLSRRSVPVRMCSIPPYVTSIASSCSSLGQTRTKRSML